MLDSKLMIQADPQHYQSILKILKELDVPPRQILLEAKIYSIDHGGSVRQRSLRVLSEDQQH